MKSSLLTLFSTLSTLALAQVYNESAPFKLILQSSNATLDGAALGAIHDGAAIETLTPGSANATGAGSTFTLVVDNYDGSVKPGFDPAVEISGFIKYNLVISGNQTVPSGLHLNAWPATDTGFLQFEPGLTGSMYIAFDKKGKMTYISNGANDRVSPPVYQQLKLYQWYICYTQTGYARYTLVWAFGDDAPQNPSCQKVQVLRQLI